MFALGVSNFGSYWFMNNFLNINGDDDFGEYCKVRDADSAQYANVANLAKQMTNRETCLQYIQEIFKIMDLDSNGNISRCEDAKLQYASGSKASYALKFSSPYSKAAAD